MKAWQKTFILIYGLVSIALLIVNAAAQSRDRRVEAIRNYRTWAKGNDKPLYLEPSVGARCAGPLPEDLKPNPHVPRYFTVYVNETGRKAFFAKDDATFPSGSVIVKEKYPAIRRAHGAYSAPDFSATPELLTVMIKHDPGYDKANGDWEFFACDGNGNPMRGSVKHCQACHQRTASPTHVFRYYVPSPTSQSLRAFANLLSQI